MYLKKGISFFILSGIFTLFSFQTSHAGGADQMWWQKCVDPNLLLNGDFQSGENFFGWNRFPGQWSVGPSLNTQLIKYDFAKEKAGFNTAVGLGASFRFYPSITLKNIDEDKVLKDDGTEESNGSNSPTPEVKVNISQIHTACRQTTFGAGSGLDPRTNKSWDYYAAPLFSITPTLYATKPVADDDLSLQPALLLGFFEDILNIGVGFNLTGPSGEKGNVFMLMGIGYGFSF